MNFFYDRVYSLLSVTRGCCRTYMTLYKDFGWFIFIRWGWKKKKFNAASYFLTYDSCWAFFLYLSRSKPNIDKWEQVHEIEKKSLVLKKPETKNAEKKNVWQVDMFVLLSSFIDILMLVYRRSLEQYSTIALTFNYEEKLVSHERKTTWESFNFKLFKFSLYSAF